MELSRRTFTAFVASAALAAPARALPLASSLYEDLQIALAKNQPLIVMAGFASCPYCKLVRQNYMPSVQREHKLAVVEVDIYTDMPVLDPLGVRTTHRRLAKDWGIKVSPTLLFFGRDGREVSKRLVGVSENFYNAYLEERISEALASFKK